jgi:hypothetical protein
MHGWGSVRAAHQRGLGRRGWAPVGWPPPPAHSPAAAAHGRPQAGISAIDFVAGHPRRGNLGSYGPVDQFSGQGRFGRETPLIVRDSGVNTAVGVLAPGLG